MVLYSRDVQNITGRSPRTSRKLLQKLRLALGKEPDEFVTITEFCEFYGFDEEKVKSYLKD